MGFSRTALMAVLALLALNAIAYGGYFLLSPSAGAQEFGLDAPGAGSLFLVRLAGAGLLGFAGFALLALAWLWRRRGAALGVSAVLGATYLVIGAVALNHGSAVDALIYGGFGAVLLVLCVGARRAVPK